MSRLVVKHHGVEIANLKLEPGSEYIAGRAPEAQIRLSEERGISRQHLKFYERDGVWVCEALSKFLLIQQGSNSFDVIELSTTTVFTLPPFEFHFEPDVQPQAPQMDESANPAPVSNNLPVFVQPRINVVPGVEAANPSTSGDNHVPDDTAVRGNSEATVAGVITLVPYIRIGYPNTADDEVLKLEGHLWVAGRERDCEIMIDSPHISRKHFELARTKEGFFLTDLGSSNGTKINGQRIPAHEPTKIESGDEIVIMNIRLQFEIRDNQFTNRLDLLPVPAFDPMLAGAPINWYPPPEAMHMPMIYQGPPQEDVPGLKDWKKIRPHHIKKFDWKKNKVRVILVALVPILIFGLLNEPKKKEAPRDPASAGNSISYDNLKPEQKNVVKDSFHLARNLYVQGKYALCLTELAKVHEIIPQFENSKELQSFCEQGLELVRRQEDADRKERERIFIEQQISGYVENCKQKLTSNATVDETRHCLSEAIVLAPEHPLVLEMIDSAQMREQERKSLNEIRRAEDARTQRGVAHFNRAAAMYKDGRLFQSKNEFERFLRTEYPRVADKKEDARRQLASITQELKSKVSALMDQCKSLGEKSNYKEAYNTCDKAVDEDPENSEAKTYRSKMLNELKRQMKTIYEDSVLEESLGNVDSAKEKWRRIMQEDIKNGEYAQKAKSKLQKYGGQ